METDIGISENIPELKLENSKVILPEKEVPLMINGQLENITIKKISSGERRDIMKQCMNTKFVGQQMQGNFDGLSYQIQILQKAIIKAPFPIEVKFIETLPEQVLDYLYKQYSDFFGDVTKKKD